MHAWDFDHMRTKVFLWRNDLGSLIMNCRSCGDELPSGNETHCPKCGEPLDSVSLKQQKLTEFRQKMYRWMLLLCSAEGLFLVAVSLFISFFTIKANRNDGIFTAMPKVDRLVTLTEAELIVDLIVILTICFLGAVVIIFEKNSRGIRQIVVGVLLLVAGLVVYLIDKGKVELNFEKLMREGGRIAPGPGFNVFLCGACLVIASGMAMMVLNYIFKRQKKKNETVYSDTI